MCCTRCSTTVEGEFLIPRLARLDREDQQFLELFVLSSGSLKTVAAKLESSYPSVRKRLDKLIETMTAEVQKDEEVRQKILKDAKEGNISLDQAKAELKKV
jgi:hypothetical protein